MAKTHRVSGRAVIIKDDKIMIMRYKGGQYYNFPGGGVKEGETLVECAKSEVLEESGVAVVVGEMIFTLEVETKRYGISGDPHINVFFSYRVDDNVPIIIPSESDCSPDDSTILAVAEGIQISKLKEINFLSYIPDNKFKYVQTSVFNLKFLSGHFKK